MPCRCDYLEPTAREIESVNVINLLLEVGVLKRNFGIYGSVDDLDEHTAKLCKFCQDNDVTKYSLELQIWWRDHKKADKLRLKKEQEEIKKNSDKEEALSKLTDYEKELLGL